MVSVWVGRQIKDVLRHFGADCEDFIMESTWLGSKDLNQGLNAACAVQVHRHLNQGRDYRIDELLERRHIADFDKFLA